jgi:hypothetical protein
MLQHGNFLYPVGNRHFLMKNKASYKLKNMIGTCEDVRDILNVRNNLGKRDSQEVTEF